MKRPLALVGLASLLMAPGLAHAAGCSPTLSEKDAAAVIGVIEAYRTAWLRGDAKGVLATLTADAVLLPAHGAKPVIGTDAITKCWWPGGGPTTKTYGHPGPYLNVLKRQPDGSWRISHHMWDDGKR